MELKDIQKNDKEHLKNVVISVRTTKANSEWMKENKVSPTILFNKALEEIMESTKE